MTIQPSTQKSERALGQAQDDFDVRHLTTPRNMKTKQLANVLIKILGLSVVVQSIPSVLHALVTMMRVPQGVGGNYWYLQVGSLATLIIGIYLILKSRDVAEYLFKDDDE